MERIVMTLLLWHGGAAVASAQLAPKIENPTGKYLVWGDYRVEVNQYGDLGRNWPTPRLCWEQYEILRKKARANPQPPNTIKAVLLVLTRTEAVACRNVGGQEVEVGRRSTAMTSADVKWALEQWREFEDMIHVYSGGNAWLRTDIKVIDEPIRVRTDENWTFWSGQHAELLDRYIPFERGEYQSYNAIYNSRDLGASPHGGTIGAVGGIKGVGTSDTAFYGEDKCPHRTGYVALHEWLNQQCSVTSNILPYPDEETLWNNYVLHKIGYREDVELDAWPWLSLRRDTMLHIIRPGMWRRWTPIDPYLSLPIERWVMFGPRPGGQAREVSTLPASQGQAIDVPLDRYGHLNLTRARVQREDAPVVSSGTYYFRTYVESTGKKEVRLWAGADERFQLWLNGVMVRDGWGWNYSLDDGRLFEKVAYVTLEQGFNTLVLALPNENHMVEFRVRFCDVDGSGRQPDGVTALATLADGQTAVPLVAPVVPDFRNPKFHTWAEVSESPWLTLPRLDQAALRELTGIDTLAIRTTGQPRHDPDGNSYTPQQHLFLAVPEPAVASPWIPEPAEDNARLNNDLDYNWKSLAWLRLPGRAGPEKDVLLLRFDVAEPLMHLLKTRGRPGHESLVGWVLVDHKLAYVVLVNLDLDEPPESALGLLSRPVE